MYFPGANAFATCGPVNCETLFQNLIKLNSVKLRLGTVDFPQSLKGMRKGKLRLPSVTAFRSNSIFFSGESRLSHKEGREGFTLGSEPLGGGGGGDTKEKAGWLPGSTTVFIFLTISI